MSSGSASASTVGRRRLRQVDGEGLAGVDRRCWTAAPPIGPVTLSLLDQPLDLRPRLVGQERGQELVEPHAVVLGLDDERAARTGRRSRASGRPRPAERRGRDPAPRPSTTSMTIASGTRRSDTNCEVDSDADHAARIAAVELDDEARDRVEQHVAPERASGNGRPLRSNASRNTEDQQLRAGFVELRRVERHVERRADVLRRGLAVEGDRPRHRRRPAEAAAGEEAAEAADRRGRARSPARTRRSSSRSASGAAADVPERDDDRGDQAAVEHAARAHQVQQSRRARGELAVNRRPAAAAWRRPAR